jgi:hypothetical protein
VGDRITAAFAGGFPDPLSVDVLYTSLFVYGDGQCPGPMGYSVSTPFQGCQSTTGWEFAGYVEYTSVEEPRSLLLQSDVTITSPEGERYVGAGKIDYASDGDTWTSQLTGTWGMPGAEGWLDLVTGVAIWSTWDGATLTAFGGYQGAEDEVYLEDVVWGGGALAGTLSLRDPSGYWYDLVLGDGGCGEVSFEGEALGEGCVNLDATLDAYAEAMQP